MGAELALRPLRLSMHRMAGIWGPCRQIFENLAGHPEPAAIASLSRTRVSALGSPYVARTHWLADPSPTPPILVFEPPRCCGLRRARRLAPSAAKLRSSACRAHSLGEVNRSRAAASTASSRPARARARQCPRENDG